MIDINILLDVFLHRQPHYAASAQIVSHAISGTLEGVVSAHGLTTIYYLARKQADRSTAEAAVDHIIQHLHIASLDNAGWQSARRWRFQTLRMPSSHKSQRKATVHVLSLEIPVTSPARPCRQLRRLIYSALSLPPFNSGPSVNLEAPVSTSP
ncbi:MAG TPA: PIN domain-containing protein [Verrucomicrobiales bacterium]|nr:PIN domain-containing protein [Verrucomicrobiales bacterium]